MNLLAWLDGLAPHRRPIYLAARIFALLFVLTFVLAHGAWTRVQEFHGPFQASSEDPARYALAIGSDIPFLSIPSPRLAAERAPGEASTIELWANGRSWDPPEAPDPEILQGKVLGLRGLHRTLLFTLPAGVPNDASTVLKVRYAIGAHRSVHELIVYTALALVALALALGFRTGECGWLRSVAGRLILLIPMLRVAAWALAAGSILYLATIIYGLLQGDALPTATVMRLIPAPRQVAAAAPYLPLVLLALAAAGAVMAWAASLKLMAPEPLRRFEDEQVRFWRLFGLPVLLCVMLFMLSSGGWAGLPRPTDMNYMSIAGLVPHSDAAGYYKDTFHLAYFGDWELMGTRRPLAEAFRELITVPAGYAYTGALIIQLAIIAVMLFLAALAIAAWRGIWAGTAFAALGLGIVRSYLATTLTEPLGCIWGLFALVFFVLAVRYRSLPHALLALAILTIALMMRMGALFAVPFLVLWIGAAFGSRLASRMGGMAAACAVVVAVLAVNVALEHLYGAPGVTTGDNFSQTTCGLSLGGDWTGCYKAYATEIGKLPDERSQSLFFFVKTWENIRAHPAVILGAMAFNAESFLRGLPPFMLAGYDQLLSITTAEASLVWLPVLAGILCVWRRAAWVERSFWIAILASMPLSAAIIMQADGWRLLHVTHFFIAAFLAMGFAAPGTAAGATQQARLAGWGIPSWRPAAAMVCLILAVFLAFPALAHALAQRALREHPPIAAPGPDEEIVTGGRRMSGFLVIADDAKPPQDIPALHATDFVNVIRWAHLEEDFGPFLDIAMPKVPFAFVGTGRMDGPNETNIYFGPPELLQQAHVWAWRLTTRASPPGAAPWNALREVIEAKALP